MKSLSPYYPTLCSAQLLVLLGLLAQAPVAFGGGVITNCTQADLQSALAGGGEVTFATNGTITLTSTLSITQDTAIDASGYQVTLSGGGAVRLFQVTNANFQLNGVTLADGRVFGAAGSGSSTPGQDAVGACILNQGGTVSLAACTLTNHSVQGGNAGTNSSGAYVGTGAQGLGGALCSFSGQINLTNCVIENCSAQAGTGLPSGGACGGALYLAGGGLNAQGTSLQYNQASGGAAAFGGAICATSGQINVTNCLIENSLAQGADARGGALYLAGGGLNAQGTTLQYNQASGGAGGFGGAIHAANNALLCAGSCVFSTNGAYGGYGNNGNGGALSLAATSQGWFNLCVFSANLATSASSPNSTAGAGLGGAVFNQGEFRTFNSSFSKNSVLGAGGSLWGAEGLGQGGALYSSGTVVINGATFDKNLAHGGQGYNLGGYKYASGGPAEGGAIWSSGSLAATNSTWAANQAIGGHFPVAGPGYDGPARGGALCVAAGTAALVQVTLAGNYAALDSGTYMDRGVDIRGGDLINLNGSVAVWNSIFADGTAFITTAYGTVLTCGSNVWGTVTDGGYNLSSDDTGGFTNTGSLMNTDPLLVPLADNGGPTATIVLLPGSPARDQIPAGFPLTDQRGASRPQGPAADMGAVEAAGVPTVLVTAQTVPPGLSLIADGTEVVTAPHVFYWETGSCHTLDAGSPGTGGRGAYTQFLWSSWSDSGAVSHQVCASNDLTNTASFRAQYYLTMSPGANPGGTISPTNGWYDAGQSVPISATPNSGFTFSGWDGFGTGSPYTGTNNPSQVTMTGWVHETALFTYTNPCYFSLSPTNADFPADQEPGVIQVSNADTNCPWTIVNPCNWVVVTSQGSPTVNYLVQANSDTNARSCTLNIAGLPFTVTQAGKCAFYLDSARTNIGPAAMSGILRLSTRDNCSWMAVSSAAWLHTTNSGIGSGPIWYAVDANPDSNSNGRFGTITVQDQVFSVLQAAMRPVFTNGTFHGLVSIGEAPIGQVTLSTTSRRTFTGRLFVDGAGEAFHGQFDSYGKTNLVALRRGKPALVVNLQLEDANTVAGTVAEQGGAWVAALHADREVFTASDPCDYAGLYTFAIPGSTNPAALPGGDSYGSLRVNPRGRVTLAGSLADGTTLAGSTFVAQDGRVPLFAPLYQNQGLLGAWVQLPLDATNSLSGQGDWIKPPGKHFYPAGLNEPVTLFGMKYSAPVHEPLFDFADGFVSLAGGNLPGVVSLPVKLLPGNKAEPVGTNNLRVSFNAASGRFTGSFSLPPAQTRHLFHGILIRQQESGYGYFLGTDQSGYVRLGAGVP